MVYCLLKRRRPLVRRTCRRFLLYGTLALGRSEFMKNVPCMLLVLAAWTLGPLAASFPHGASAEDAVVYANVTAEAGIDFVHSFGDDNMSSILEATGSGCMFFDYDQDGWMDLYVVSGAYLEGISDPPAVPGALDTLTNRLYRNQGDGTFVDVTAESGAGDPGYGMACVTADYNGTGWGDIFITNYGRNTLLRNNGDGTFADRTLVAGVGDTLFGVGATFLDINNNGHLDLFVGNYLEFDPDYRLYYAADLFPGPLAYAGQPDVLYRNEGDGTFTEITAEAGVLNEGRAMGVMAGDLNRNGLTDIFVANDAMANYMYMNQGDGTFIDVALEAGVAFSAGGDASASMGAALGDINQDGNYAILVPDMNYNNLYVRFAPDYYMDRTAPLGLAVPSGQYISWHGDFLDYDNNGYLDIFITTGDAHRLTNTMEPLLLANVPADHGGRRFQDISSTAGDPFLHRGGARGAAVADYDNDGDLDLFILYIDQPSVLLRNEGGNRLNWLQVDLRGTRSHADAFAAHVRMRAGHLNQWQQKLNAVGYLSQNDPRLHFGLGQQVRADTVTVQWPGGGTQHFTDVPARRMVHIIQAGE